MFGTLYLAIFIFCGLFIVRCLLPRHTVLTRTWLGTSLGLLLLMWLPALMAFAVDFTVKAHLLALLPLAALTGGAFLLRDRRLAKGWDAAETTLARQMLTVVLPLTLLSGYLQFTHYVRMAADGSWWGGQSTYGDLAMHMSFVTSLKNASFPPEYSLFPGQQLSYPFLMDSLSTSLYLMGFSLQASMVIPGTLMMALCYMGVSRTECTRLPWPLAGVCSPAHPEADSLGAQQLPHTRSFPSALLPSRDVCSWFGPAPACMGSRPQPQLRASSP